MPKHMPKHISWQLPWHMRGNVSLAFHKISESGGKQYEAMIEVGSSERTSLSSFPLNLSLWRAPGAPGALGALGALPTLCISLRSAQHLSAPSAPRAVPGYTKEQTFTERSMRGSSKYHQSIIKSHTSATWMEAKVTRWNSQYLQ